MYVVIVDFRLARGATEAFLPLMKRQAQVSLETEAGCRQFDICVDPDDPCAVLLYEIYDDRAAFEAHLASPHFLAFDRDVAAYVANKSVRTMRRLAA